MNLPKSHCSFLSSNTLPHPSSTQCHLLLAIAPPATTPPTPPPPTTSATALAPSTFAWPHPHLQRPICCSNLEPLQSNTSLHCRSYPKANMPPSSPPSWAPMASPSTYGHPPGIPVTQSSTA